MKIVYGLSYDEVVKLKNNGYSEVGRYLTNTPGSTLNKKLTREELNNFLKANMRVFPIFQTSGRKNTCFSSEQGKSDALTAKRAAKRLGFPKDTVIYFAADYDVIVKDLVQDVDALNLSKNYDWNKMSTCEIFEDYYCFEQCKRRFSIFKENLLSDFSCNTLVEVVEIFTENDYTAYAALFGLKIGLYPTEYAKTVSSAFASRVEMLIKEE